VTAMFGAAIDARAAGDPRAGETDHPLAPQRPRLGGRCVASVAARSRVIDGSPEVGFRAVADAEQHAAHHREVAELIEDNREQRDRGVAPVEVDAQPGHQPGPVRRECDEGPRPSAQRLMSQQPAVLLEPGNLERSRIRRCRRHRHPLSDLEVLELGQDAGRAGMTEVVQQVIRVKPGP
jgi:hypothetical protein